MDNPNWQKCTLCADSKEIIKRIPDNSIDFILTDPPYNLGKHSTGNIPLPGRAPMNNDVAQWDMEDFNPEEWADEFIRILKPTGNLFIFTSYNQLGRWYNCLDHRFDTTNFMIWHKTNPAPKIFKAGFLNSCEMIFTCWNKKHTWNFSSQSDMHNFIESPICMRPERLQAPKHPAQKPVSILSKMIKIASNPGDIVFDPFMGTGSVGDAALRLGRRFIGVEKDRLYFDAAKKRIEDLLCQRNASIFNGVKETDTYYGCKIDELTSFFNQDVEDQFQLEQATPTNLSPIIKWPGGKEKELTHIIQNAPRFRRLIDPFVGGGSVFMGICAREYVINDLSTELIDLYESIAMQSEEFYRYVETIDKCWSNADSFLEVHPEMLSLFYDIRQGVVIQSDISIRVQAFCKENATEISQILLAPFNGYSAVLIKELQCNLSRKLSRMSVLEVQKNILPDRDVYDNILTAIKSAIYMTFRVLYNDRRIREENKNLHTALFFFIRNYAYSGMFRYSSSGDFNVPYGGIAYNNKLLFRKLSYYRSVEVESLFKKTSIFNLDFEEFLREVSPTVNDFVFLDPPYDSEFSTYAQNPFTRQDQIRLADYLLCECEAKWMMIIKNTDFIYSLYNQPGINIRTFDKEYLVSFMNRNNRKVTHLLITNY